MATAQSFAFTGDDPERAARAIAQAARLVTRPVGMLVFVCGTLADRLPSLARGIARAAPGLTATLASGAGVVSERGEIEGQSAMTGIVWAGGSAVPFSVAASAPQAAFVELAQLIRQRSEGRAGTAFVFSQPTGLAPHVLEPLTELKRTRVLGAGTVGTAPVVCLSVEGLVSSSMAGGMLLLGVAAPLVCSSAACRLLMPLKIISKTRGPMVLEIEGSPALEVLSAVAEGQAEQLVFAALASETGAFDRREILIRAVQGVDPVRRGLVISEEAKTGMRIAFAVRDAKAARDDLQTSIRELVREANGAAPRFGVYLNCAGRGHALYGARDVDLKILRSRVGDLPLAGMQSSFEISEMGGRPSLQLYTGVFGLFSSPS